MRHPSASIIALTSATATFLCGQVACMTLPPSLAAKDATSNDIAVLPMRGGDAHRMGAIGGFVKYASVR